MNTEYHVVTDGIIKYDDAGEGFIGYRCQRAAFQEKVAVKNEFNDMQF